MHVRAYANSRTIELATPSQFKDQPMDESHSVGLVERQYFTFAEDEPLPLDSGETLGPITLAYETYGQLNADRSNAILICTPCRAMRTRPAINSPDEQAPGWWDDCIGPGKAFDTNKYFVICSNVIGGCQGSTGPGLDQSADGQAVRAAAFRWSRSATWCARRRHLIDHLGIDKLLAVAGGSMGGMQVLQWAASYPERVRAALPIATTARHSPMLIAFERGGPPGDLRRPQLESAATTTTARAPTPGWPLARMIGHITYLSEASMHQKFGRRLQERERFGYDFETDFAVEGYLRYKGNRFTERFDANSYLYVTKAMDYFDLSNEHGSLAGRLPTARSMIYLVVSFTSDWLYPTYHSKELVSALDRGRRGCDVTATCNRRGGTMRFCWKWRR